MSEKKRSEKELSDKDLQAVAGGTLMGSDGFVGPVSLSLHEESVLTIEPDLDPILVNVNNTH